MGWRLKTDLRGILPLRGMDVRGAVAQTKSQKWDLSFISVPAFFFFTEACNIGEMAFLYQPELICENGNNSTDSTELWRG